MVGAGVCAEEACYSDDPEDVCTGLPGSVPANTSLNGSAQR